MTGEVKSLCFRHKLLLGLGMLVATGFPPGFDAQRAFGLARQGFQKTENCFHPQFGLQCEPYGGRRLRRGTFHQRPDKYCRFEFGVPSVQTDDQS